MTPQNEGTQRDELLDDILASALANLADYTDPAVEIADTILSEGYRKPRTVTTIEELDGLPEWSVIRSGQATIWEKLGGSPAGEVWAETLTTGEHPSGHIALPATVLYEPEAEVGA